MNIERPGSPSATTVAPTSKRRSTSIENKRSRLAPERPPKKGVARRNAFRSGELTAIDLIYSRSQRRQAGEARREVSAINSCAGLSGRRSSRQTGLQPNKKRFTVRRIIGSGDLWVTEFVLTYDGIPSYAVSIMEFREGLVANETQYFADRFDPAPSRAHLVERVSEITYSKYTVEENPDRR